MRVGGLFKMKRKGWSNSQVVCVAAKVCCGEIIVPE